MSNLLANIGLAARGFVPTAMALDQRKEESARRDKAEAENTRRFDLQEGRAAAAETTRLEGEKSAKARDEFTKNEIGGITQFAKQQQILYQKVKSGTPAAELASHAAQAYNTFLRDGRHAVVDPTTNTVNLHGEDGNILQSMTPDQAVNMMFSPEVGAQAKQEAYQRILANGRPDVAQALFSMDDKTATRQQTGKIADDKNAVQREGNQQQFEVGKLKAGAAAMAARAGTMRTSAPKGLTLTQERSNEEIQAARDAVAGMSPQDIARRTAKATNTGRENPDYDPGLARQASLAGRRKVGEDEAFDTRQGAAPAEAPASDRADVAKRFRADKTMMNRTLGKETQHGVEVLEKGRLIGYFQ